MKIDKRLMYTYTCRHIYKYVMYLNSQQRYYYLKLVAYKITNDTIQIPSYLRYLDSVEFNIHLLNVKVIFTTGEHQ